MTQDPNTPLSYPSYTPSRRSPAAARAGWLMLALGILMLLGGGLFIAFGFLVPITQLSPDQVERFHQLEAQMHASLKTVCLIAGSFILVCGIYHIVLGLCVRQGWRGAIYTGIVTSFLALGWWTLSTLGGLTSGGADVAPGICFLMVIGAAFAWLLVWLFQALRGSGSSAAAAQYQAQYWQIMQQQQAYGQAGGVVPPPPHSGVLAPPPPPQPPSPDPAGWAYGPQTPPPAPPSTG